MNHCLISLSISDTEKKLRGTAARFPCCDLDLFRYTWTGTILGMLGRKKGKGSEPSSYNIFDRKADFNNDYGWSKAVDEADYKPLRHSGLGVYLVNLTAGSMMAPHVNPRATEYGVVLKGTGTIQIVYPNGTLAMNAKVTGGDVFWIPIYFPFCQIASRTGPFEFFGYTTSSHKNRPQFLVGANSLLHTLKDLKLQLHLEWMKIGIRKSLMLKEKVLFCHQQLLRPMERWRRRR